MAVTVRTHERPPLWRDATVLKWTAQVALLVALGIVFVTLANQATTNIEARGITFGWDFLDEDPLIPIREGISTQPDSGSRALYTGIVNTLRVAISGIMAATILGTIIGVARLSTNWISSKTATLYIETIRNIPLLVQMFFWLALTSVFSEIGVFGVGKYWILATTRGVSIPWLFPRDGFYQWLVLIAIGAAAAYFVYRRYAKKKEEEGGETYAYTRAIATLLAFAVVGWFVHPVMSWVGVIWDAISSLFGAIPTGLLQAVLASGLSRSPICSSSDSSTRCAPRPVWPN